MKRKELLLAILLVSASAHATELRVNVIKEAISFGNGRPLLYTIFSDEPMQIDVTLLVSNSRTHPAPKDEVAALWNMPKDRWTNRLHLVFKSQQDKHTAQAVEGAGVRATRTQRTEGGPHAHDPRFRKQGDDFVLYEARLELRNLTPGDYVLEASLGSLRSTDSFAVRRGDEDPRLRSEHLAHSLRSAQTYDEYKRIQLERLKATPSDASILRALGQRAMYDGTIDEANGYFDRAVETIRGNSANYARDHPGAAGGVRRAGESEIQRLRGLQSLLPDVFSRRGSVLVSEERTGDELRWVVRDRATRQIIKIGPAVVTHASREPAMD
ncbi:MAG TPA: hypothetical protein VK504_08200 [Vicinamibacterales bacterium]|nr:hypothetical protein [Vicinamibacterales bacterium]